MADLKAQAEALEARKDYPNLWHTTLIKTVAADCPYCCFAIFCPWCASYLLRKRTLYDDMTRYTCCGGYMPCSGKCGEKKCPEFCLCVEVVCCFAPSVASTRYLIQDEFNIKTTACDNCIIAFMIFLQYLACICSLIACITGNNDLQQLAQALRCLSDLVYCIVCGCMQTQAKVELDKRDGKFADQGAPPLQAPRPQAMAGHPGYPPPPPQPAYEGQQYGQPPQYSQGPPMYAPQQQQFTPQQYPPQQYGPQQGGYPPPGGYPPKY